MLGLKPNKPIGDSQRSHFTTITKIDFFLLSLFKFGNDVVVWVGLRCTKQNQKQKQNPEGFW